MIPHAATNEATSSRCRRGIEVLELTLVMPLLFLTLVAGVQLASIVAIDTTLCHASLEASRISTMGCDVATVADRIDSFLAVHNVSLFRGSRLVIEDATGRVQSVGDSRLSCSFIGTPLAPNTLRTVLLLSTDVTPIPNLSPDFGCVGKQFQHVAVSNLSDSEWP